MTTCAASTFTQRNWCAALRCCSILWRSILHKYLRPAAFAALALTAVLTSTGAVPAASGSGKGVLPPLKLQAGSPLTFCLTDASEKALDAAGIELDVIAPSTLVSEGGHPCMRSVLESGQINTDLTGLVGRTKGGFALHRGSQRAEFADPNAQLGLNGIATFSAVHQGKRIDVMTASADNASLSLTEVSTKDAPMLLTKAGSDALAAQFTTSPVPAGGQLFAATGTFKVLPAL